MYFRSGGARTVTPAEVPAEDPLGVGGNPRELLVAELVLYVRGNGDPDAGPDPGHQLGAHHASHHLAQRHHQGLLTSLYQLYKLCHVHAPLQLKDHLLYSYFL